MNGNPLFMRCLVDAGVLNATHGVYKYLPAVIKVLTVYLNTNLEFTFVGKLTNFQCK